MANFRFIAMDPQPSHVVAAQCNLFTQMPIMDSCGNHWMKEEDSHFEPIDPAEVPFVKPGQAWGRFHNLAEVQNPERTYNGWEWKLLEDITLQPALSVDKVGIVPFEVKVDTEVVYVPKHRQEAFLQTGDFTDCEFGKVTSWNPDFCFVRFEGNLHPQSVSWWDLCLKKDVM